MVEAKIMEISLSGSTAWRTEGPAKHAKRPKKMEIFDQVTHEVHTANFVSVRVFSARFTYRTEGPAKHAKRREKNRKYSIRLPAEFALQISRPFACLAGGLIPDRRVRETREKTRKRQNTDVRV
jgi:hypothetical protein